MAMLCSVDSVDSKKVNEFSNYRGHVRDLVCTQSGSKNLQAYINSLSDAVCEAIVEEIVSEVVPTGCEIICDTFGNYFYQVRMRGIGYPQLLFKKASASQKELLLRSMLFPKGSSGSTIYEISVNKTGTFAFQNIIDFMSNNRVLGELIVKALSSSVVNDNVENVTLRLIREIKGTHIIQRIMKTFDV